MASAGSCNFVRQNYVQSFFLPLTGSDNCCHVSDNITESLVGIPSMMLSDTLLVHQLVANHVCLLFEAEQVVYSGFDSFLCDTFEFIFYSQEFQCCHIQNNRNSCAVHVI